LIIDEKRVIILTGIPALKHFVSKPSYEEIRKEVAKIFHDNEKLARQVSMYLCHKDSGMGLQEIGTHFEVRDPAISEASRRLARQVETDGELRRKLEKTKGKLIKCGM